MKITCTNEEKKAFLNAYDAKPDLPCFRVEYETGCVFKYNSCSECLEKNIEWEIREQNGGYPS